MAELVGAAVMRYVVPDCRAIVIQDTELPPLSVTVKVRKPQKNALPKSVPCVSLVSVKSNVAVLPSSTERLPMVGVTSVAVLQGSARVILKVYPAWLPLKGSLVRVDVTV